VDIFIAFSIFGLIVVVLIFLIWISYSELKNKKGGNVIPAMFDLFKRDELKLKAVATSFFLMLFVGLALFIYIKFGN
jgi:hypothetical protein